jgi:ornithine cyclodeaminase/alanine dehydrogenase
MLGKTILYLSKKDVQVADVSMQEVVDALSAMFKEKGEGKVEMPPKPGIHTRPDAFIHAMPAYIPSMHSAGMKWVGGYPQNQGKGLPYITGLMILNDDETGIPYCIMDCTWVTAMRTGAATAVSAKYFARKDSSTVGICACGVQGRSNIEALSCIFKIKKVKAFDMFPKVAEKFAREMKEKLGLQVEVVKRAEEAVRDLDIVVTSGPILKNPAPVVQAGWLKPGGFASLVDFDSYFNGKAIQEAEKLSTDDIQQMEYYRKVGYFKETPVPYADLGEIVAGKKKARENDRERCIAINLGIALDDMAVAPIIYARAREKGIGTELPL